MNQPTVCPTCDGTGTVTQDIDQHGRRYIHQPVEDRDHVCDDCDGTGQVTPEPKWCDFHHHYEDTAPCTCPKPDSLPFPAPVSSGEAAAHMGGFTDAADMTGSYAVGNDQQGETA